MGEPGSRDYEVKARKRLTEFTQDQQITYLDFLGEFNDSQTPAALYRDHIHLSPQGNQKVTEAITRSLQFFLPQLLSSASTTPATPQ
jgi:lysophospholipase L1-like esterase